MIFGAHVVVHSKDAIADRAFLREVLGLSSVDAGLYFMCDDLKAEISRLAEKGVRCSELFGTSEWKSDGNTSPVRLRWLTNTVQDLAHPAH
jgi:hypothetical protein